MTPTTAAAANKNVCAQQLTTAAIPHKFPAPPAPPSSLALSAAWQVDSWVISKICVQQRETIAHELTKDTENKKEQAAQNVCVLGQSGARALPQSKKTKSTRVPFVCKCVGVCVFL